MYLDSSVTYVPGLYLEPPNVALQLTGVLAPLSLTLLPNPEGVS